MNAKRITFLQVSLVFALFIVLLRLFYWQVIASENLTALGEMQHLKTVEIPARRGEIRTSDGFPLVTNKPTYLIYAYKPQLEKSASEVSDQLSSIFANRFIENESTGSAQKKYSIPELVAKEEFENKLKREDAYWIPLIKNASYSEKEKVEELRLKGLGIEASYIREYPEASMAASITGFVGSDTVGNQKGYFGLEGYYDLELKGRPGLLRQEKDASGKPIIVGEFSKLNAKEGRDLVLNIDRVAQRIVEEKLKKGIEKYQSISGEIIIMNPKTGAVVAMASYPGYCPANFSSYQPQLYKNPTVSESYEPGSTFKVLVMAAALDAGVVKPDTKCDICDKPATIGSYTIKTWNDEYYPDSTMEEVIEHSDNVGMVYVAGKLGKENLFGYLQKFGIGSKTGIDLEEESSPSLRELDQWKEIDLATASFGQGIALTGIQMVRAVSAIANRGFMVEPRVVQKIIGEKEVEIKSETLLQVISPEAASKMTMMMVNAVDNGESKWIKPKGYKIAGKTGTAQIPVAGHYDEDKTIASFIGFAPADDPQFVMLVKLREPQTSPWGSETAAPLWFSIANDLLFYYGIQPEGE